MKIIALIPARKGSVRVRNKNMEMLGGLPLVLRKAKQLLESDRIDQVFVGTNDDSIREALVPYPINIINRDEFYCDESVASANEMIGDMIRKVQADIVVWAHCTNPFLYPTHYDAAIDRFLAAEREGYDSLLTVYKIQSHMWNHVGRPTNYNPYAERHTLGRDLEPVFFQDGGIFIQRHASMINNSYFFGKSPLLYEIDFYNSHDINTMEDLEIARRLVEGMDKRFNFLAAA